MKVLVEQFITSDAWSLTGVVKLRIYARQSFWNSDGQFVPQGIPGRAETAYLEIDGTVTGTQLTIDDFEIDSTVDGLDNVFATYDAELVVGTRRIPFLTSFPINTLQVGDPSTTWPEIIILRNMFVPQTLDDNLVRQIAALIQVAAGNLTKASETNTGVTALTVNPIDPIFPIAVAANDPVWLQLTSGSRILEASIANMDFASPGRVIVNSFLVTDDTPILLTGREPGITGVLHIESVIAGVSFEIVSSNGGDSGLISWAILSS